MMMSTRCPSKAERQEEEETIAQEASPFKLRPRVRATAPPVTLQSLYELLLEEQAARHRIEGMVSDKRDARIVL